ncbi:MAG: aldolase/citrate lyase family protein [Chloroflexota bacterium]|nr:aldolase/citrate lyase family protein [Chloroflexota bacterium]
MTRINKAIELLEQGQPVYNISTDGPCFEKGVELAKTWADCINVNLEHHPFDMAALDAFMHGLIAGGPTRSGHRTPTVIVTLPMAAVSEDAVRANSWMINQALTRGVHGLLLCHAETPGAVRAYVESGRFAYMTAGVGEALGIGRRGGGGQDVAAKMWGLPLPEYMERCDVWPLNPKGEIILGIKIENRRALANVEASTRVPGLCFAEWGPGDMGMSFGYPDRHDPPYPPEVWEARNRVFAALKAAGCYFQESGRSETLLDKIKEGVKFLNVGRSGKELIETGRKFTNRTMPW